MLNCVCSAEVVVSSCSPNCRTVLQSVIPAVVSKKFVLQQGHNTLQHHVQTVAQGSGYKGY